MALACRLRFGGQELLTATCYLVEPVRGRRRTLTLPPWVCPKNKNFGLNKSDLDYVRRVVEHDEITREAQVLFPRVTPADVSRKPETGTEWTPESKRVGLIATKLGMAPQWLNDGTRVLCTLLHVQQNHVVQVVDPETWFTLTTVGKRKAFTRFGPMWKVLVGAGDADPFFLSAPYRRIFEKAGVPPKEHCRAFLATEDAVPAVGTQLDVRHFQIGQYVNVTAKSIDWGFQGVVHRWGMRGQPQYHTTKSHRRVGSIGSTGDARVWPGRRLPGHMGYEWSTAPSLQVLRINPVAQVIYVKGCVPGDAGEVVMIKDCTTERKRVENPPFPTFVEEEDQKVALYDIPEDEPLTNLTGHEIYHESIFRFNQPSIVFTEEHETKSAAREKGRAKIAKVKK